MKVFKIDNKAKKYRFGEPFNTETVLVEGTEIMEEPLEFLSINKNESIVLSYNLDKEDIVFGLGENQRGINKRGGIYESFCTDDPFHTEDKKSLYGAHNFLVVDGKEAFGVFVDFPGKVIFDVGYSSKNKLSIIIENINLDLYIIKGNSIKEIVKNFLNLIGDSYVPPKWAFGYQQSRWSYKDKNEINEVANNFIENKIPCDAIYLDIDYMERFKDFTIDNNAFPNFKKFTQDMKKKGFRLIPIIDAGIKIEDGYGIYEEGIKNNYFCKDENDEPFLVAVWPGKCHFPDFLNKDVRDWFGLKYKILTDLGIEGFWNDMNEPAIFYTDRGLKEAIDFAKESEGKNIDINSYFELQDKFKGMSNNLLDYKSFYHNIDGNKVNHYQVHNLFGYNMTRSASEGLKKINKNKRYLLFSRSSYIGMHRYSGIWTGDNCSWWQHILLNIKMMPSLNMCGFLYIGGDTGGFGSNSNAELIIRWTQFSIFTPLFRNHSARGTRKQEPFAFDRDTTEIMRNTIELRYALIPYIYSEYMKAVINKEVYFSPIMFEYDDEMSRRVEDQLLVGKSLMVAPIYEENAKGRYVYLPEDMLLWKAKNYKEKNYEIVSKGHSYIDIDIDEVPIFIRKNKMLVIGNSAQNVHSIDNRQLTVIAFVENTAHYKYYDDDGITYDYKKGKYLELDINITKNESDYDIKVNKNKVSNIQKIKFEILNMKGEVYVKIINL